MKKLKVKAWFDRSLSAWGLIALSPFFAAVAILVKLTSKGPIFYIAPRIGQHGNIFNLYKFRTMFVNADREKEGSVTVSGDRRITPIGRILRKTKIDELPSLFNVLKGEMSFVGPRPDVSGYADNLAGSDRRILELRPGITSPATIKYANEEELLASIDDPIAYNKKIIFPDKVRINLEYMNHYSPLCDLILILRTVFRPLLPVMEEVFLHHVGDADVSGSSNCLNKNDKDFDRQKT